MYLKVYSSSQRWLWSSSTTAIHLTYSIFMISVEHLRYTLLHPPSPQSYCCGNILDLFYQRSQTPNPLFKGLLQVAAQQQSTGTPIDLPRYTLLDPPEYCCGSTLNFFISAHKPQIPHTRICHGSTAGSSLRVSSPRAATPFMPDCCR